jgi:hypothetical protein
VSPDNVHETGVWPGRSQIAGTRNRWSGAESEFSHPTGESSFWTPRFAGVLIAEHTVVSVTKRTVSRSTTIKDAPPFGQGLLVRVELPLKMWRVGRPDKGVTNLLAWPFR